MLKCNKCGQELPDNAKFCFKCGDSMNVTEVTTLAVSELDVVKTILDLDQAVKDSILAYQAYDIGTCPYTRPIEPVKPERDHVKLISYPKLELEPEPDITEYLPKNLPMPELKTRAYSIDVKIGDFIKVVLNIMILICIPFSMVSPIPLIFFIWVRLKHHSRMNSIDDKHNDIYKKAMVAYNKKIQDNVDAAKANPEYLSKLDEVQKINRLRKDEYDRQVAIIDEKNREIMIPVNKSYDEKMHEWRKTIYADYEKELIKYQTEVDEWYKERESEKQSLLDTAMKAKAEYDNYVSQSRLVPLDYRDRDVLSEIYNIMSQSRMSVKEAINLYDNKVLRSALAYAVNNVDNKLTAVNSSIRNLSGQMCDLNESQYAMLDELAYSNDIAEQTRHDVNRNAAVDLIQGHLIRKDIKAISKTLDR